jgi:hypothetical protein
VFGTSQAVQRNRKVLKALRMLTKQENIEMWMLLEQAVCVLKDLEEGKVSPKEQSVAEVIASIQEFRRRIRPKIVAD